MKTILLVNGAMNFGGTEIMIMDILRKLKDEFRFVFLINRKKGTQPIGDFDQEIKGMNIPMYYIDAVWDVGVKAYERQFREVIQQIGNVDVVHSHLNSKGGIISRCAYKCGIKRRIVHCHAKIVFDGSLVSRIANNAELKIQRMWIKKYATDFWGCSKEALPSLFNERQIAGERCQVIHNAINLNRFICADRSTLRNELNLTNKDIIIGSVGRIAAVKNYELATDIIKELWDRGIDVHYVVAGDKQNLDSAEYMFNTLGSDRRFHYLGVRTDVENLYASFDVYLGTSKREGLGLSVVEAQASGVNCLISAGFPTLCDIGIGLVNFVNSNDCIEWADSVECLLSSLKKPSKISIEQAVKDASFDIETEAIRLKNYYNED